MSSTDGPRDFERIAHRGAPRELLENTLPSFERALERGAQAIELDVHATSDGVVVVHHDPVLGRAVDPLHHGLALADVPWRQLREVELTPGLGVPTLAEVLDLVGGRARVYVEIKGHAIEPLVVEVVRRSEGTCALHSFDAPTIAKVAEIAPELRRGILLDEPSRDIRALMRSVAALDVWPEWRLIDSQMVDAVHEAGGRVVAWTVNSTADAERLVDLGVDGICTDDLRLLPR